MIHSGIALINRRLVSVDKIIDVIIGGPVVTHLNRTYFYMFDKFYKVSVLFNL